MLQLVGGDSLHRRRTLSSVGVLIAACPGDYRLKLYFCHTIHFTWSEGEKYLFCK